MKTIKLIISIFLVSLISPMANAQHEMEIIDKLVGIQISDDSTKFFKHFFLKPHFRTAMVTKGVDDVEKIIRVNIDDEELLRRRIIGDSLLKLRQPDVYKRSMELELRENKRIALAEARLDDKKLAFINQQRNLFKNHCTVSKDGKLNIGITKEEAAGKGISEEAYNNVSVFVESANNLKYGEKSKNVIGDSPTVFFCYFIYFDDNANQRSRDIYLYYNGPR